MYKIREKIKWHNVNAQVNRSVYMLQTLVNRLRVATLD